LLRRELGVYEFRAEKMEVEIIKRKPMHIRY
jgi:hypothetical protein